MSASYVMKIISDICMISYSIPLHLLAQNEPQLVAELLEGLRLDLKIEHPITTTYHLYTNKQVWRYNKARVAGLLHYTSDHQNTQNE